MSNLYRKAKITDGHNRHRYSKTVILGFAIIFFYENVKEVTYIDLIW